MTTEKTPDVAELESQLGEMPEGADKDLARAILDNIRDIQSILAGQADNIEDYLRGGETGPEAQPMFTVIPGGRSDS